MSKNLNVAQLYGTIHRSELYDAEHHLKNSYLKNLLKTPESIEEYKEQLEFLKKKEDNRMQDTYVTLRYIFNEFGYIDEFTMKSCLNAVNKHHNTQKRHKKMK